MNKENKLILQGIRWLITRDSMKPQYREIFDNSIVEKIDKLIYPHKFVNDAKDGKK